MQESCENHSLFFFPVCFCVCPFKRGASLSLLPLYWGVSGAQRLWYSEFGGDTAPECHIEFKQPCLTLAPCCTAMLNLHIFSFHALQGLVVIEECTLFFRKVPPFALGVSPRPGTLCPLHRGQARLSPCTAMYSIMNPKPGDVTLHANDSGLILMVP